MAEGKKKSGACDSGYGAERDDDSVGECAQEESGRDFFSRCRESSDKFGSVCMGFFRNCDYRWKLLLADGFLRRRVWELLF